MELVAKMILGYSFGCDLDGTGSSNVSTKCGRLLVARLGSSTFYNGGLLPAHFCLHSMGKAGILYMQKQYG